MVSDMNDQLLSINGDLRLTSVIDHLELLQSIHER